MMRMKMMMKNDDVKQKVIRKINACVCVCLASYDE